jgi:uncharacterized membrane protein
VAPGIQQIRREGAAAEPLNRWLWALLAIYSAARVAQAFPDRIPIVAIVALHVLPPLAFALLHGAVLYRLRGILVFVVLCLVVGNVFENLGVLTGFPFGHYHFTAVMGPKLFEVPILLGLAYVGMGYLSWTLAGVILGDPSERLTGSRVFTHPLAAAFIMVAWDLSMDPVWSNLVHAWIWEDGGAWFGVPVSNFLGWYLTLYVIYQSFALWVGTKSVLSNRQSANFWRVAVLFYGVSAIGNLFVIAPPGVSEITDASGATWRASSILHASALVSIFVMGAFAFLAWLRVPNGNRA